MRGCPGRLGSDRGSGTVLGLATIAVVLTLTLVIGTLGAVVAVRGAAQAAADLAALAAAQAVHRSHDAPAEDPCGLATRVAGAHASRVEWCRVSGDVVEVAVAREVGAGLVARATARAGPAAGRA